MTFKALPSLCLFPLLVLTAFCGGCRGSGHPQFASNGAHISESSDAATVVAIEIRTINLSEDPLPLTKVEYSVEIDGKPAVTGTRSAQCTAHRFSEQVFTLPAVVPGSVKPSSYRVNGTVTYVPANLVWRVLYDEGIHRPSESFAFEGTIDPQPAAIPARPLPELTPPPPPANPEKKSGADKTEPKKDTPK